MSMRKRLLSVLSSFSVLLIAFSSISVDLTASAYDVPEGCVQVSAASMRAMLGDSFDGQYLKSDGTYGACTFVYYTSTTTTGTATADQISVYGRPVIIYRVYNSTLSDLNTSLSIAPTFIASPYCNFTDVSYADWGYLAGVDLSALQNFNLNTARQYNFGEYNFNNRYYADMDLLGLPYYQDQVGYVTLENGTSHNWSVVHKIIDSSSSGNFDFGDFTCSNLTRWTATVSSYYVAILCPILNSDYVFTGIEPPNTGSGGGTGVGTATGTITGTVGTEPIDVDVNIDVEVEQPDLTEQGPLSWLGDKIDALVSAIGNLFIPSDEAMQEFSDDIADEFHERLGGISELDELLDEQFDYIYDAVSVDTIYLGEIHAPVQFSGGSPVQYFDFGGYHVELRPHYQDLHVLYDAAAYMFDITALLMVLNMLKTKHEILLNPEGECIHYDN